MNIREDLIPINPFSRPGHLLMEVRGIVIHWVGKSRQTANAVKAYFESLKDQSVPTIYASTQYAINNNDVIKMIPENEVAYHVGAQSWEYTATARKLCSPFGVSNENQAGSTPNWYTIGIELNHLDMDGTFSEETYVSAVELTADLCKRYKLNPKTRILRHYDVTGKLCPKFFVMHPVQWDCFIGDVVELLEV